MCTVTYIPLSDGNIVTANRDETPLRNANGLSEYANVAGELFLIAKEPIKGGTNLAIGRTNTTTLLNGAFRAHKRETNYKTSRGLVVLKSLDHPSLEEFSLSSFEGIEPFTLLRFGASVEELRWDGTSNHVRAYSPKIPFLVASAKLYSPRVLAKRQRWFKDFLASSHILADEILDFHLNGGDGDPENDMVMNRGGMVRTVSVSSILSTPDGKAIGHNDLIREKEERFTLLL